MEPPNRSCFSSFEFPADSAAVSSSPETTSPSISIGNSSINHRIGSSIPPTPPSSPLIQKSKISVKRTVSFKRTAGFSGIAKPNFDVSELTRAIQNSPKVSNESPTESQTVIEKREACISLAQQLKKAERTPDSREHSIWRKAYIFNVFDDLTDMIAPPIEINFVPNEHKGKTLLWCAAHHKNYEMILFILKYFKDANFCLPISGNSEEKDAFTLFLHQISTDDSWTKDSKNTVPQILTFLAENNPLIYGIIKRHAQQLKHVDWSGTYVKSHFETVVTLANKHPILRSIATKIFLTSEFKSSVQDKAIYNQLYELWRKEKTLTS